MSQTNPLSQTPIRNHHRWYDRYNNITMIYALCSGLPRSKQMEVGQRLIEALRHYDYTLDLSTFKALGPEAVLNLYKSQKRQRWYDQVPALHTAMDKMTALPKPILDHFDDRCDELVEHIKKEIRSLQKGPADYQLAQMEAALIELREEGGRISGSLPD